MSSAKAAADSFKLNKMDDYNSKNEALCKEVMKTWFNSASGPFHVAAHVDGLVSVVEWSTWNWPVDDSIRWTTSAY